MYPVSLDLLIQLTGGRPTKFCDRTAVATGAAIDSRRIRPGDIFFALTGPQTHGAHFSAAAIRAGAVCVISEEVPELLQSAAGLAVIHVSDTIAAMTALAAWCRRRSHARVIGVTGSVGKTTTKRMISHVLAAHGTSRVIQSPASFNNHLGVPLSLMLLDESVDHAVLELGASAAGEIATLTALVQPHLAVVTRVAPAHLTGFGGLTEIRRAKAELPSGLDASGVVLLNADDRLVRSMAAETAARVLLYGEHPLSEFRVTDVRQQDEWVHFCVNGSPYQIQLPGRMRLSCAAAAVATGLISGLSPQETAAHLREFQLDAGRGAMVCTEPWTLIDDSYNASPASLLAAVEALSTTALRTGSRRVLVLGDMLELGDSSAALHYDAGMLIGQSGIECTLLLGPQGHHVAAGIHDAAGIHAVSVFTSRDLLLTELEELIQPGDVILIKGSRGMQMEFFVNGLLAVRQRQITRCG